MTTRTHATVWTGVCAASLALHLAAFGGLAARPSGSGPRHRPPALVEMQVAPPPPPVLAASPAPAPTPRRATARAARVSSPRPTAPAPSAAPPPAAEAPADFTGTTLTNEGGPGWASATGNGAPMNGPVGGGSRAARGPASDGPAVVGVGDLARPPAPPDLAPVLERCYPPAARHKGLAGKAVVRARIMPDGGAQELALVSESGEGFGAACRQALRSSRWTPPIDREGHAVSTYVSYTCSFEVR